MTQIAADIIEEAVRITDLATAAGVTLRVLGGVAVALHAAGGLPAPLKRNYEDIDLVTTRNGGPAAIRLLCSLGYVPNERFNALNGHRRLVAYDLDHKRRVDVFVGEFRMCHSVPVAERLDLEPHTVPLAELFATKLQIVELNAKDVKDLLALLAEHDVGDDDVDTINAEWLSRLLGNDWGLWRTATGTLATVGGSLDDVGLDRAARERIAARVARLGIYIDRAPKSLRWKSRARIGSRVKWYDEPEEIAHGQPDDA